MCYIWRMYIVKQNKDVLREVIIHFDLCSLSKLSWSFPFLVTMYHKVSR